jgi:Calx-beta domain
VAGEVLTAKKAPHRLGHAQAGSDCEAKTGTLTFAPGETTKTITIEVKGDSKKEANETFYLDLYGLSSNGLFTKSRGVGMILNDD